MSLRKLVLAAPVIFAIHVAEEAPGFVTWFNRLVLDYGYLIVFRGARLF